LLHVQALVRDVLRAVQVQMHLYEPHELLDLAEAAVQLARPSQLWMQVGGLPYPCAQCNWLILMRESGAVRVAVC
jgi:hypothetical protein